MPIGVRRGNDNIELAIATKVTVGSNAPAGVSDDAWSVVGIRVKPVSPSIMKRLNMRNGTDYVGGLHIASVRSGSAAQQQGIHQGDILVGIHNWRTASLADLAGILEHPRIQNGGQALFYLVRGNETLYGQFKLAARSGSPRR
ncbi:MAG: PDZ domain-containing protein, partial [Planctomycetota bacterium]